jgi:hypothetical protein
MLRHGQCQPWRSASLNAASTQGYALFVTAFLKGLSEAGYVDDRVMNTLYISSSLPRRASYAASASSCAARK